VPEAENGDVHRCLGNEGILQLGRMAAAGKCGCQPLFARRITRLCWPRVRGIVGEEWMNRAAHFRPHPYLQSRPCGAVAYGLHIRASN
jgi:hypothetical protein